MTTSNAAGAERLRRKAWRKAGEKRRGPADEPEPAVAASWRRASSLVDEILAHANDPWVRLSLGSTEICRARAGGLVVVMGPSGVGKSSLLGGLLVQHAREQGPAICASLELPADEMAARWVALQTDSSWTDVLTGQVPRAEMERVLDLPRLIIGARKEVTLNALATEIAQAKASWPDEAVLVAVDYVQLVPGGGDEARARTTDVMERLDELARHTGAVFLVVSQMSRVNARAARDGTVLGIETMDGGAESAAIERFASVTLAIGAVSPPDEEGMQRAQLSLGKYRMGRGDRVYPLRIDGRSGRMCIEGEARHASDVRAEAKAEQHAGRLEAVMLAMVQAAEKSKAPVTREYLREKADANRQLAKGAVERLLAAGDLVEVRQKPPRSPHWLLWTRSKAESAGIGVL